MCPAAIVLVVSCAQIGWLLFVAHGRLTHGMQIKQKLAHDNALQPQLLHQIVQDLAAFAFKADIAALHNAYLLRLLSLLAIRLGVTEPDLHKLCLAQNIEGLVYSAADLKARLQAARAASPLQAANVGFDEACLHVALSSMGAGVQ